MIKNLCVPKFEVSKIFLGRDRVAFLIHSFHAVVQTLNFFYDFLPSLCVRNKSGSIFTSGILHSYHLRSQNGLVFFVRCQSVSSSQ